MFTSIGHCLEWHQAAPVLPAPAGPRGGGPGQQDGETRKMGPVSKDNLQLLTRPSRKSFRFRTALQPQVGEAIHYSGVALLQEESQHFNCYIVLSEQNEIFSSKSYFKVILPPGPFQNKFPHQTLAWPTA